MHEKSELIKSLIFYSSFTFSLMILILGLLFVTLKNKQQNFHTQLILANNEFEKNLLNAQIEIQEQTLQLISREIHDNIGLSLTLAKLNLNTLSPCRDNCSNTTKVNDAIGLLTQSIQDLSTIAKGMNFEKIKEDGLSKALETEIARANKVNKTRFSLRISDNLTFMPTEKELIIFRIIQEGINNILRHANAKHAKIELSNRPDYLFLEVADDGIGMPNGLTESGNGLKNIKARTRILEGELQIRQTNPGTSIQITIPINTQN